MPSPTIALPRFYVDENILPVGKALAMLRRDIVYPGHPGMSSVQLGAPTLTGCRLLRRWDSWSYRAIAIFLRAQQSCNSSAEEVFVPSGFQARRTRL